ncbi:uncharacterized protein Tco025E_05272 [Trypanosoma conorhini]|uniref:tRNA 4-demethylwyosine synthase (AdoMet-dependent) n=1 Tax=Trypanosoma conorhini TaxID=83891 RepID=A0A3R7NBL1_9TRYP|nr:uncharacterized protein Tco025E_05272 [Trypanosoma conorhini]RNF16138.1 hypothetical protein Tco025E_05272 [Trypanosoma conorhini]
MFQPLAEALMALPPELLLWTLLGALLPVVIMTIGTLLDRWRLRRKPQQTQAEATEGDATGSGREAQGDGCCTRRQAPANGGAGKKILIAYATQSNTACKLAHKLFSTLNAALHEAAGEVAQRGSACCGAASYVPEVRVLRLAEEARQCSVEHLLESHAYSFVVLIASTYTNGTAPASSQMFADLLQDAYTDFRVPRDTLARTRFAVFGLGDVAYGANHFNRFAKNLYTWCKGLGATFVTPPVYASEANTVPLFNVFTASVVKWVGRVVFTADGVVVVRKPRRAETTRPPAVANAAPDSEDDDDDDDAAAAEGESEACGDDVEDAVTDDDDDGAAAAAAAAGDPPELLHPRLRQNLQRQGYHLVGSHSGVKLCRWTKAMLRGRGGCYKHTFYNIASHQCMEMTPSLACANKCVFCWRHHTNPVSRTFRWKVDPPQQLVAGGIAGHQQMMKQMRGVPGVTAARLEEGMQVRHCALSLVGEPIMYPEINAFVDLLHERGISSFMVTNAQFPEQLRLLKPVTQLYLSIDAPTPEELKRVDRPLFEDYWERCLACVRELRRKPQRTVFRLTLVNQYNTENVAAYADLVRLGWPDFIEVKGVTYCGTSSTSTLTMKENVPRHEEVVRFCADLCAALAADTAPKDKRTWLAQAPAEAELHGSASQRSDNETGNNVSNGNPAQEGVAAASSGPYSIACEHEHSCCVLIALRRFLVQGVWHTWIDYDKFTALAGSGRTDFTAAEYAAPTPSWAVFRSDEKGFDPTQVRVHRKSGKPAVVTSGC